MADGNRASVGDVVITRSNTADCVSAPPTGSRTATAGPSSPHQHRRLTVRHDRNGRTVQLPADYVETAVELGYASTMHAAQGVTADTMHGVVTGEDPGSSSTPC